MKTFIAQFIIGAVVLIPSSLFAQYTEGIISIPGTIVQPTVGGIDSNDQIVGTMVDGNGNHGYILSRGVLTQMNVPGATWTFALGINSTSGVVGYAQTAAGVQGFFDGQRAYKFVKDSVDRQVTGINASGTFVGTKYPNAFISSKGVYTTLSPTPCAPLQPAIVMVNGINANGDYVGYCTDSRFSNATGFAHISGVDQEINIGSPTFLTGINDAGVISGYFSNGQQTVSFTYSAGIYTYFYYNNGAAPYTQTQLLGINNKGSLVGLTYDSNQSAWVPFYHISN